MREKNLNGKLKYLFVGTALAIFSSVITTVATKIYEKNENRKVLFYNISNMDNIPEKEKAEKVCQKKIRCTISYNGRETATFVIYFITKDGYSISSLESHPMPVELPPAIIEENDKAAFTIENFRETQRIDFDIKVKSDKINTGLPCKIFLFFGEVFLHPPSPPMIGGDCLRLCCAMPIPSDVLRLKIIPSLQNSNSLIIKRSDWKHYIDKWNIYFIIILIVIIIVLVLLAMSLYYRNRCLERNNSVEY